MTIETRLTAGGLDASASGTARPFADTRAATLRASIVRANLAPLGGAGRAALPVTASGQVALKGNDLTLSDLTGTIGGAALRGRLGVTVAPPHRWQGDIEADTVDGAGVLAAAIGFPAGGTGTNAAWVWPSEPFGDGVFGDAAGQVAVRIGRVDLSPRVTARQFSTTLRLGPDEITFDDISGQVAGGRLAGTLSFVSAAEGLKTQATLSLTGADAASLLPPNARPPVTGAFSIAAALEGSGLSPVALFGSLKGSGTIGVADAQFAGLDPRAFDVVTRAVDLGLPVDATRITTVVSRGLDAGRLAVRSASGAFTVSAGQMRLAEATAAANDAALAINGRFDLTTGILDARLVLSGLAESAGNRPDVAQPRRLGAQRLADAARGGKPGEETAGGGRGGGASRCRRRGAAESDRGGDRSGAPARGRGSPAEGRRGSCAPAGCGRGGASETGGRSRRAAAGA